MRRIGKLGFAINLLCLAATGPSARAQSGACCLDGGVCISISEAGCASAFPPGDYQGDGSACPGLCGEHGACCFTDGSCEELFYGLCNTGDGTFNGGATVCLPNPCPAPAPVPTQINHQGVVSVNGQRFSGTGFFYFAIIDPATDNNVWTNDATNIGTANRPIQPVTIACVNGLYSVRLGDLSLAHMKPIPVNVFASENRTLRIWFDDGTNGVFQLTPDHPMTSVPYAFRAPELPNAGPQFGGTGVDGALAISNGVTSIDLGGSSIFTKNYTSISISGLAKLTFTNPHPNGTIVILKSQGDVTISSSAAPCIDLRVIGAAGGAASQGGDGGDGALPSGLLIDAAVFGGGGKQNNGPAGVPGTQFSGKAFYTQSELAVAQKRVSLACGAGGGGGGASSASGAGGYGGRGGGALYMECGGALDFTGTIDLSGENGENGDDGSPDWNGTGLQTASSGGGGGGAGGMCLILYNVLVNNSGNINNAGGSGGSGGLGFGTTGGAGSGGGGAGSLYSGGGGSGYSAGGSGGNGRDGSGAGGGGGPGGGTSNGLVTKNTEFP